MGEYVREKVGDVVGGVRDKIGSGEHRAGHGPSKGCH